MGPTGLLELYWSFVKIGFTSFGGFVNCLLKHI